MARTRAAWASKTLSFMLAMAAATHFAAADECVPYQLPDGYTSFQKYCQYLQTIDDDQVIEQYASAPDPKSGDAFPLHGAVLGCIAGASGANRANSLGLGRWSGKDFGTLDTSTGLIPVQNIVDNSVGLGGSVVNAGVWANGLSTQDQFPGTIGVGQAWSDRDREAWILNYNSVQTGAGILNGLIANTRDELRQVGPGVMIGRTYAKPFSSANPLPVPVNEGAAFYLFQVCDASGGYPANPNDRALS
ncbi:hypothetical protein ACKKBG_A11970 [Auxenochlorella protothecoides x Auxenochlorella symbiontica]